MRKLNELMIPGPVISFGSPRKISSYIEKCKLYPLVRMVGSAKYGK